MRRCFTLMCSIMWSVLFLAIENVTFAITIKENSSTNGNVSLSGMIDEMSGGSRQVYFFCKDENGDSTGAISVSPTVDDFGSSTNIGIQVTGNSATDPYSVYIVAKWINAAPVSNDEGYGELGTSDAIIVTTTTSTSTSTTYEPYTSTTESYGCSVDSCGDGMTCCNGECVTSSDPFEPDAENDSLSFKLFLGALQGFKNGIGFLKIKQDTPSAALATPNMLEISLNISSPPEVEVIQTESNVIRQVRVPQGLVDVVTLDQYSYEMRIYKDGGYSTTKNTNGLYEPYTGENPMRTFWIGNPNASTNYNNLNISNIVNGSAVGSWEFVASIDGTNNAWELSTGGGIRKEYMEKTWTVANQEYTKEYEIKNSSDELVEKRIETWRVFGSSIDDKIKSVIYDPDGASLIVSNEYYEATGRLKFWYSDVNDAQSGGGCAAGRCGGSGGNACRSGGWGSYVYDSNTNVIVQTNAWLDSAVGAISSVKVTLYSNTPVDTAHVNGTVDRYRPRVEEVKINNITVSKKYYSYYYEVASGVTNKLCYEEECPSVTNGWNNPYNLQTITKYYPVNMLGRGDEAIKSIRYPDGRLDSYTNEFGIYTPDDSLPGFSANEEGTYLRKTVTHGTWNTPEGIAMKSTQETFITDPAGKEVMRETYVYTGSGYTRRSWTTTEYDSYGHPIVTRTSDGLVTESSWGNNCCGKESETNAYGEVTLYSYDLAGRLIETTKKGTNAPSDDIKTKYTLDASGRHLVEIRTNGTSGLSLVVRNAYDLVGRLTNTIDSAGLVTTYLYANGGRTKTVIMPGGLSTNVTELYIDGRARCEKSNGEIVKWYDYGVNADGTQWSKVYSGPQGTNSMYWTKTTADVLGMIKYEEKSGYSSAVLTNAYYYDSYKRLVRLSITGQPDALYEYDELGNQVVSAIDINGNNQIDTNGMDRITENETLYEIDGTCWRVNISKVCAYDNSAIKTTNSIQKTRGDISFGYIAEAYTFDVYGNHTISRTYLDRGAKQVIQYVQSPDSSNEAYSITVNGLLVTAVTKAGVETCYLYDSLGRQTNVLSVSGVTQERLVGTVTHYNDKGQVDWGEDAAGNRTSYAYESDTGRKTSSTDPLANTVYYSYDSDGRLLATWGATYPVRYAYDSFGRITNMFTLRETSVSITNYASFISNESSFDKTAWRYDEASGLLTNKLYADGRGPSYTYTSAGKLLTRKWARSYTNNTDMLTTYSYSNSGELVSIAYSDSNNTPSVSFTYDRLGRQKTIADASGTRMFTYNDYLVLASETNVYAGISRNYNATGRVSNVSVADILSSGVVNYSLNYSYATNGRTAGLSWSTGAGSLDSSAEYTYVNTSDLVAGYTVSNEASVVQHQVARTYEDNRNLIAEVLNLSAGGATNSIFEYTNDAVGRRTVRVDDTSITNSFGYNGRSELTNSVMNTNGYSYTHDNIGNRLQATNNAENLTYLCNSLNQYTNIANGVTNSLRYDYDGNLTNDGIYAYAWDGENRLISVTPTSLTSGSKRVKCYYDYMSRRFRKDVDNWNGSAWVGQSTNKFIYDGWNVVAEIIQTTSVATNYYVWGLDLSGSLQGAGGIGGLIARRDTAGTNEVYYFCDANGNVTDVVNTNGASVAHYTYDPYGNVISSSGTEAGNNKIRFSSKYWDDETGLGYWGMRYYHPEMGRWVGRDMLGDLREPNIYNMCCNNKPNKNDLLGMLTMDDCVWNYFGYHVDPMTANFSEVDTGVTLENFGDYDSKNNSITAAVCKDGQTRVRQDTYTEMVGGWAGHQTFLLTLTISRPTFSDWEAVGKITAMDNPFDFNSLPWGTRKWYDEAWVRMIGFLPVGQPFNITFTGSKSVAKGGKCSQCQR